MRTLNFTPDDRHLVLRERGGIQVYDSQTGVRLTSFGGATFPNTHLCFDASGNLRQEGLFPHSVRGRRASVGSGDPLVEPQFKRKF